MSHARDNGVISSRHDLNDRLAILRVRPDSGLPPFVPGQFVQLGLRCGPGGRIEKRAYSIASSPADRPAFELLIALVPAGRLTPALWSLRPGDPCWVDPTPLGAFTLEHVPAGKDLVLVATGTGIAPYVSMLRTYARGAPCHEPGRWNRCMVVHGARRSEDLAYADEILAHRAADPSVCYLPTVSREPERSGWSGLRGRVQAVLAAHAALDPSACHVFLCGNPDMIDEVRTMLVARGFTPGAARRGGNVHTERYW